MFQMFSKVRNLENITTSVLLLHVKKKDHGSKLVCRAENPLLSTATLEDIFTLNVACEY